MGRRLPTGHDVSPSRVKTFRTCPAKHHLKHVERRPDPGGPDADVGKVYHEVAEAAGASRLAPTGDRPEVAGREELLGLLERARRREPRRFAPFVWDRARELLEETGALDLTGVVAVEEVIDRHPLTGTGLTAGGIVDRVDRLAREGVTVTRVVDYKTGFQPPREELEDDPQTAVYLDWADRTFHGGRATGDELEMCFWWPAESDRPVSIPFDRERVAAALVAIARDVEAWRAGERSPRVGAHCSSCPYRADCAAYKAHVRKPARAGAAAAWGDLSTPELVAARHQLAGDATLLEEARKDVDRLLLERPELSGGRLDLEGHEVRVIEAAATNYPAAVVGALARALGLSLEEVVARVCTVGTQRVEALARERPEVGPVVEAHAVAARRAPYLRVRARGGLF